MDGPLWGDDQDDKTMGWLDDQDDKTMGWLDDQDGWMSSFGTLDEQDDPRRNGWLDDKEMDEWMIPSGLDENLAGWLDEFLRNFG